MKPVLVDVLRRRKEADVSPAERAKLRIIDLDQDGSYVILNKISDPSSWDEPWFAGQLIHLDSKGADVQAVLQSLDEETNEFVLENVSLGADTHLLRGALYFAVVGNHVGLIEGQAVKSRTLERYLTRLFQEAGEIDPGEQIILNGKFTAADGKELKEISELNIRAKPTPSRATEPGDDVRQAGEAKDTGATVFDVLRLLGWNDSALDRLRDEAPAGSRVEGLFRVYIRSKRRNAVMSRAPINEALRNIDPADLGLKGAGSEKGGIAKLSVVKSIQSDGSLLDPEDAMLTIIAALREWAEMGKIDCRFD